MIEISQSSAIIERNEKIILTNIDEMISDSNYYFNQFGIKFSIDLIVKLAIIYGRRKFFNN